MQDRNGLHFFSTTQTHVDAFLEADEQLTLAFKSLDEATAAREKAVDYANTEAANVNARAIANQAIRSAHAEVAHAARCVHVAETNLALIRAALDNNAAHGAATAPNFR